MRKTVAVDASFLNVFLDKRAHSSIQNGAALIANLVNNLDGERAKVIIPTPALAQVLTHHPRAGQAYVEHIRKCACFQIRPFDDKAAFELAQLLRENVTKNILKFDRQIVAIAKVYGASVLYANDEEVVKFAAECGLQVVRFEDLQMNRS